MFLIYIVTIAKRRRGKRRDEKKKNKKRKKEKDKVEIILFILASDRAYAFLTRLGNGFWCHK